MAELTERKIRAAFPFLRFMQSFLPLPVSHWLLKQGMARVRLEAGVSREAVSAGGVPCEWVVPSDSLPGKVLLYLHGGGYVYGLTPLHLKMGAYLARRTRLRLLMVDYRLAPRYPFPAALDDCLVVYGWLLKQGFSAREIVLAGDSAGGNLAITSMMKLRDRGLPLPAAAACLSPVTDLSKKGGQPKEIKDPLLPPKAVKLYSGSYLGQNDPRNPLISPVYGDLHGLPPILVHAGEDETLREDAVRFTDLAKAAGVDVRLEVYPHMFHVWQLYLALPQAVQSLEDISQFLLSHLGTAAPGLQADP
jgi:monoterpene epsilon-lactone hydrolase